MNRVLKVNSSGQTSNSITRKMVDKIAQEISGEEKSIERDVSKGIKFIDKHWIEANFTEPDNRTDEHKNILEYSDQLVKEVMNAEHIIIGAPIYNFSIPATLKAWIDMIARARLTFMYTENGPVGLLKNKTAHIAMASGGVPIGSEVDYSSPYLKQVLKFIGITDVKIYQADDLNINQQEV